MERCWRDSRVSTRFRMDATPFEEAEAGAEGQSAEPRGPEDWEAG